MRSQLSLSSLLTLLTLLITACEPFPKSSSRDELGGDDTARGGAESMNQELGGELSADQCVDDGVCLPRCERDPDCESSTCEAFEALVNELCDAPEGACYDSLERQNLEGSQLFIQSAASCAPESASCYALLVNMDELCGSADEQCERALYAASLEETRDAYDDAFTFAETRASDAQTLMASLYLDESLTQELTYTIAEYNLFHHCACGSELERAVELTSDDGLDGGSDGEAYECVEYTTLSLAVDAVSVNFDPPNAQNSESSLGDPLMDCDDDIVGQGEYRQEVYVDGDERGFEGEQPCTSECSYGVCWGNQNATQVSADSWFDLGIWEVDLISDDEVYRGSRELLATLQRYIFLMIERYTPGEVAPIYESSAASSVLWHTIWQSL